MVGTTFRPNSKAHISAGTCAAAELVLWCLHTYPMMRPIARQVRACKWVHHTDRFQVADALNDKQRQYISLPSPLMSPIGLESMSPCTSAENTPATSKAGSPMATPVIQVHTHTLSTCVHVYTYTYTHILTYTFSLSYTNTPLHLVQSPRIYSPLSQSRASTPPEDDTQPHGKLFSSSCPLLHPNNANIHPNNRPTNPAEADSPSRTSRISRIPKAKTEEFRIPDVPGAPSAKQGKDPANSGRSRRWTQLNGNLPPAADAKPHVEKGEEPPPSLTLANSDSKPNGNCNGNGNDNTDINTNVKTNEEQQGGAPAEDNALPIPAAGESKGGAITSTTQTAQSAHCNKRNVRMSMISPSSAITAGYFGVPSIEAGTGATKRKGRQSVLSLTSSGGYPNSSSKPVGKSFDAPSPIIALNSTSTDDSKNNNTTSSNERAALTAKNTASNCKERDNNNNNNNNKSLSPSAISAGGCISPSALLADMEGIGEGASGLIQMH